MSKAPDSEKAHSWFRCWAEVSGAWAISLAYPLYVNIASGPEALTSYGVRRPDLLALVIAVSLLGPLLITGGEIVIRRLFGERVRLRVHAVVIGALLGLVLWQWLLDQAAPGIVRTLLPLLLAAGLAWLYVRTELVRNFAQILSLATVVVIAFFLLDYPVRDEVLPHEARAETATIEPDVPVVVVVFDELPLAALQQPGGTIDPRFPAFARLALDATWYPDAVSLADQTLYALPSILTGRTLEPAGQEPPAPGEANYPNSVCRIAADGGYEIHAYEPITDLCDRTWDFGTRITATIRRALGADDPASPVDLVPTDLDRKLARGLNNLFEQPYTEIGEGRREAFDRFIDGLPSGPRSLSLLHSTLPHVYWMYLPDGRTYPDFRPPGETQLVSPEAQAEVDRDAQQMMLQLQFTDRELGRLIRRMKENGTWDDALFVVTADHGAAFHPGGSRRMVNMFNNGWILPVPMFIKFPGQQRGRVVPGTVDGRDIATTVMSAFGLDPLPETEGTDLTGKRKLERKETADVLATIGGIEEANLDDVRRHRRAASKYMHDLFSGSFYALGGHPELIGRAPDGLTEIDAVPADPSLYEDVDTGSDELPAYFQAELDFPGDRDPGPLAIALNGRIVATAKSWPALGRWYTGVVLPAGGFRDGDNEIRVYRVGGRPAADMIVRP